MSPTLHLEAVIAMRDWYRSADLTHRVVRPDPEPNRLADLIDAFPAETAGLHSPACRKCGDPLVITDVGATCRQCRMQWAMPMS